MYVRPGSRRGPGLFGIDLEQYSAGSHSIEVRGVTYDSLGMERLAVGAWVSFSFSDTPPPPTFSDSQYNVTLNMSSILDDFPLQSDSGVQIVANSSSNPLNYELSIPNTNVDGNGTGNNVLQIGDRTAFAAALGTNGNATLTVTDLNGQSATTQIHFILQYSVYPPTFAQTLYTKMLDFDTPNNPNGSYTLESDSGAILATSPLGSTLVYSMTVPGLSLSNITATNGQPVTFSITDQTAFRAAIASGSGFTLTATDDNGATAMTTVRFAFFPGATITGTVAVDMSMKQYNFWSDNSFSALWMDLGTVTYAVSGDTNGENGSFIASTVDVTRTASPPVIAGHPNWQVNLAAQTFTQSSPTITSVVVAITQTGTVVDTASANATIVSFSFVTYVTLNADGTVQKSGGVYNSTVTPAYATTSVGQWATSTVGTPYWMTGTALLNGPRFSLEP